MNKNKPFGRFIAALVYLAFTTMALSGPAAQAAFIGNDRLMADSVTAAEQARTQVEALLARDEVAGQLAAYGVDADQAAARVANLTDQEVLALQDRIDSMPAGGDLLGVAALIFIVLIITDALGATDVFPFVNKAR